MIMRLKRLGAAALLTAGITGATPAMAEMGLSPTGPDAMYITLLGGYVNSDGTATPGHGTNAGAFPNFLFEAEHGGFGGVTAGFVLGYPMPFGLQNFRIEASFAASVFDDDEGSAALGSVVDLDGNAVGFNAPASSEQSRDVYDWSVVFKGDRRVSPELGTAIGLELFFRQSEDETTATAGAFFRSHEVDGFFAGVMAVVQPEYAITPALSFVADLGVGVYGVNADAQSSTNTSAPLTFNDNETTIGFRGRANGGLRLNATDAISITLFGGIDYWSDVPVADQKRFFGPPPTLPTVKFNDLVELKAGVSLTFLLGGP